MKRGTYITLGSALLAGAIVLLGDPSVLHRSDHAARVLFVGDMMFDRTIRTLSEQRGDDFVFSCISDYLDGFDLVVGNLEGPVTGSESVSRMTVPGDVGNTTFTFPVSTASALARNNIRMVSLANNHIFDFGRKGIGETKDTLAREGVAYFGDPLDPAGTSSFKNLGGVSVAFVGFTEFYGIHTVEYAVSEISRVRDLSDFVVVFAHWGEEYQSVTERQRDIARQFVEAGADLIVGAHPHVIQDSERIGDSSVYYSLGNFIFDQYWDESVRTGLVLEAFLSEEKITLVPRRVESSRASGPCLMN